MADRGQPLLGGRRRSRASQLLDVAGDVHRLHRRDGGHGVIVTPGQAREGRGSVGGAEGDELVHRHSFLQ
jgi:hypothetical protein